MNPTLSSPKCDLGDIEMVLWTEIDAGIYRDLGSVVWGECILLCEKDMKFGEPECYGMNCVL